MCRHARTLRVDRGFTLVELLIVAAIIALLVASAVPVYRRTLQKAQKVALVGDMNSLYKAFVAYQLDNGKFPADSGASAFSRTTLEPLVSRGYFPNPASFKRKLVRQRIQTYFAPDWRGRDSDFIVVAQSSIDPSLVFYVMNYNFFGAWGYEGVYVLKDGVFVRADKAI